MSWPEAVVVVAGIGGFVAALRFVLPYVRSRSDEQRHQLALKAANERLDKIESLIASERSRLPTAISRRTA